MGVKERFKTVDTTVAACRLPYPLHHEFDGGGNHRLTYQGRVGVWETYCNFCYLVFKDGPIQGTFVGATEHWFGELPEIFEIIPIKRFELETEDTEQS